MKLLTLATLFALLATLGLIGCGSESENEYSEYGRSSSIDGDPDGYSKDDPDKAAEFSADVEYHNPKTGHTGSDSLDVEVNEDGEVERITFPNGGWEDDFVSQEKNADGSVTVTDEDGREFTVE